MRIIIESSEQPDAKSSVYEAVESVQAKATDAGPPSMSLVQAISKSASTLIGAEGTDGNSPPKWLLEAIQGEGLSPVEKGETDVDAGSPRI